MTEKQNSANLKQFKVSKIFSDDRALTEKEKESLLLNLRNRGIKSDQEYIFLNPQQLEIFKKNKTLTKIENTDDPSKPLLILNLNIEMFLKDLDIYNSNTLKIDGSELNSINPEPTKPVWKNLEPSDKEDPVDLETSKYQIHEKQSFIAIGGSVRGKYHAHNALHRDDSFNFLISDQWSIIAVADGAGSCRLSRLGSKIAVDNAVKFLFEKLTDYSLSESENLNQPLNEELLPLRSYLVDCIIYCRNQLENEANNRGISINDLSTTLLISILKRWKDRVLIVGIQVGDGAIVVLNKDSITPLSEGDSGEYAGETTFISSNSIDSLLPHKVQFTLKQDFKAIALMTDGVADDFFPTDPVMLKLFESVIPLFNQKETGLKQSILEWLKYEKPGSFDDRTLVVLYNKISE
jgi:serine/threonine protein phosphatase PrpC